MFKCKVLQKLKRIEEQQGRVLATLDALCERMETIVATQKEMADQLKAVGDKLTKIGAEISTLQTKVEELKAAAENASPELQAAVEAVAQQAQVLDDLNPDAPTP